LNELPERQVKTPKLEAINYHRKKSSMKPKLVRKYTQPKYPTHLEIAVRPVFLHRHQPPAWRERLELTGAAGLFLLADAARLPAADSPPNASQGPAQTNAVGIALPISPLRARSVRSLRFRASTHERRLAENSVRRGAGGGRGSYASRYLSRLAGRCANVARLLGLVLLVWISFAAGAATPPEKDSFRLVPVHPMAKVLQGAALPAGQTQSEI
jgi:hypothetical protein